MTKYQVVAKSPGSSEIKVGDPEEFKTNAETHAATLRDMFERMGRGHEVKIDVIPVEMV